MIQFHFLLQALTLGALCFTNIAVAQSNSKSVQDSLRAAVVDAQNKLPELTTWQKRLMTEEVVPDYQRFIKDFRPTASGTVVEVDQASLKEYLSFFGPSVLKREDLKVLVYLKAELSCEKCMASTEGLRKLVKERLERRGLVPLFLTSKDLPAAAVQSGKALEDSVFALARSRNAAGAAVVVSRLLPPEPGDTVHADEKRFGVSESILFRVGNAIPTEAPVVSSSKNEFAHRGELEVLENDSFDVALTRLLMDSFMHFGKTSASIIASVAASTPGAGGMEFLLSVTGIRDFSHFQKLKTALLGAIKDVSKFEDRKISRGKATFAVLTGKTPDELKQTLAGLAVDNGRLAVVNVVESEGKMIEMEIR